mmetsp:Transcript_29207/g.87330  ORF Transcript_29207/g.87330 Transcript_29207/m.87330 type:complete len:247 (-) Transcript_29207:190-930(-)
MHPLCWRRKQDSPLRRTTSSSKTPNVSRESRRVFVMATLTTFAECELLTTVAGDRLDRASTHTARPRGPRALARSATHVASARDEKRRSTGNVSINRSIHPSVFGGPTSSEWKRISNRRLDSAASPYAPPSPAIMLPRAGNCPSQSTWRTRVPIALSRKPTQTGSAAVMPAGSHSSGASPLQSQAIRLGIESSRSRRYVSCRWQLVGHDALRPITGPAPAASELSASARISSSMTAPRVKFKTPKR